MWHRLQPVLRNGRGTDSSLCCKVSVPAPRHRFQSLHAEIVAPAQFSGRVCRDKSDDVVLATAVTGKADLIVTGDDDLLVLKEFRGIRILSPRGFLELLDRR